MLISGAQSLRIYCAVVLITDYTMTPEPPIKIAYLLTGTDTGGAEMFCARLVERLDPSKFEPVVISICPKGTLAPTLQATGIPLLSLNIRHKFPLAPMLRLHQTLSKFRPLILHTHLYHANILGRIVGPYTRVPVLICTEHNIGSLPQLWTWAQRCTARRADKIVAVSSAVAEHLATNLGIPGELIEVIHNGIDIEDFIARSCGPDLRSELGLSADTPIVVSVGRLEPIKGHKHLVDGIPTVLQKHGAGFVFVGDGPLRSALEAQIPSELRSQVFFLGRRTDVARIIAQSDILALPSVQEGFPNVLLEAMALSKPVVATAVGGVPEQVVDGETGLLVPPRDSLALASAITVLLDNPDKARSMGQAGFRRVQRRFPLTAVVDRYTQLYLDLLHQKKMYLRQT